MIGQNSEGAAHTCFAKQASLKISQDSRKIPVRESFFNKDKCLQPATLLKRGSSTRDSL